MSVVYDNWERLVEATFKREELRQLALCSSFSSSSSISSDFSIFDSSFQDISAPSSMTNPSNRRVRSMAFKEIKKATENFRRDLCIGQGAFGIVYKGWIREDTLTAAKGFMRALSPSRIPVAVKKWKPNRGPVKKWKPNRGPETWSTELKYLCQLDHPNVVKLIGYCSKGDNFVLVYELLRKGSLKNHLVTGEHQVLSWDTRVKVAIGTARGLSFLHDREIPVIHRDCHTDNILLDAEFNAKLCGFGFAMDCPGDVSCEVTAIVATSGYLAPEYVMTGHITTKCDTYAFGVVLVEILSGCRIFDLITAIEEDDPVSDLITAIEEDDPVDWVKIYMNDKTKLLGIMDTKLKGQYTPNEAHTAVTLGLQCLNSNPELRPRMAEVLVALQQLSNPKIDD